MKLATTTGDFHSYTYDQAECLRYIREAGFRYADYSFGSDYSTRGGIYAEDHEAYFERIKLAAEEIGIRLVQAHAPLGSPLAEDGGQFLADTIRCVDACGAWGIPNLVVHSGYAHGLSVEETFAANKKFYAPILEHAEKYGVNILVENFNKMHVEGLYWIDNATDLLELIDYIDHPLFHAVWDTGHGNLQETPQDEEIRRLGHHICALHVQDNMGDRDAHLLPFLGTMNIDAVMNGLREIGYDGYFTFEVGGIFTRPNEKRPYAADTRLAKAPLSLKCAAERYLYELGKCVLEAYDCYEE
jgi:sugar phosphate isomerase/epimerase